MLAKYGIWPGSGVVCMLSVPKGQLIRVGAKKVYFVGDQASERVDERTVSCLSR
jgi:hypothetical protein